MSKSLPPLDPRLLERLREEEPAPSQAKARARSRLALVVPIGGGGGNGAGGSGGAGGAARGAGATTTAASGVLGGHAATLIAFVLGGATGAGLHAALTSAPARQAVSEPAPQRAALPAAPVATSSSAWQSVTATAAPLAASIPPAAVSAAPTSRVSPLSRERLLLDEVKASLVQGDAKGALEHLRASRSEFPRAILGEERDALTIEALAAAHRYDEARAAATTFRDRFPDSLFSGTVEGAIRSIP